MRHFFDQIRPGIAADLSAMKILPARRAQFLETATKLVRFSQVQGRYADASRSTGVPEAFMAASFEREASSDFTRSPAQGDPLDRVSTHVPAGLGPYLGVGAWTRAAIDAYRIDGLDKIGAHGWTWALAAYYAEAFNGFGYRDFHRMRSPYVWGGTNLQQRGKYEADGQFNTAIMDQQLGVVPMMMCIATLVPGLTLPGAWPFPDRSAIVDETPPVPAQTPLAAFGTDSIKAVQRALNANGFGGAGLKIDGSFGKMTSRALRAYEASVGLVADGLLDEATFRRLLDA
jgi:lysozyme family protein